jgi:hypothetical protein
MVQPLVLRTILHQSGNDVLKLFEQVKKNIQLNKSKSHPRSLKEIKREFFDGMINDLMKYKCYELSEIVMAEKIKEKFEKTVTDEIIGLNIYASQNKFTEYKNSF